MIVMGTGSRSLATESPNYKAQVLLNTMDALASLEATQVISGMAEGFDACIALAAIQMNLPLTLAIPSPDYRNYYWRDHSLYGTDRSQVFDWYLSKATEVYFICSYHEYGRANFKRNAWMVEHSDHALVYKPESSGTKHAVSLLHPEQCTLITY